MSKKEQKRKIAEVRKQICDLKSRVTKLQSCLRNLQEDPDQYFQNLNTYNREYIDWKKNKINQKRMQKISLPMKRKKKSACNYHEYSCGRYFWIFSMIIGLFHSSASSVLAWGDSRSSSSSYGQTAPGYYSSYSHTSGGSVSFPSLGRMFP